VYRLAGRGDADAQGVGQLGFRQRHTGVELDRDRALGRGLTTGEEQGDCE